MILRSLILVALLGFCWPAFAQTTDLPANGVATWCWDGSAWVGCSSSGGGGGLTVNSTTITGGAANRVLIDNGGTLQELPYGTTGNSTLVETTSGGLLTPSVLPLATTGAFGAVKPDGTTITISGGVITSVGGGTVTSALPISWDDTQTVANSTVPLMLPPWAGGGTITSVSYYTNGASSPAFNVNVKIGGVSVTGCSAITVNSATPATTNCTAANTFTSSSSVTMAITSVTGTPTQALVQINFTH